MTINLIQSWLKRDGIGTTLKSILEQCDCTKITSIGRTMQTTNRRYDFLRTAYSMIIEYAIEQNTMTTTDHNYWCVSMNEVHDRNIQFEKENPPIEYKKIAKAATKHVASSYKTKDLITGQDVIIPIKKKKDTVADRKAKLFSEKSFKFGFKPIKNKENENND